MSASRERLEMLLVDEATGNLSSAGRQELDHLLREHPGVDRHAFERAAAAVFLAGTAAAPTHMPEDLTEKIVAAGHRFLAADD